MITSIEVRNFRALRDVIVPLRAFQVLVGPNASGKSTFFDALAFVRDVLQVGLEAAVYGNSRAGIPMRAINPRDLTWRREGARIEIAVVARVPNQPGQGTRIFATLRYELAVDVGSGEPRFASETLWLCPDEGLAREEQPSAQRTLFPQDTGVTTRRIIHTAEPSLRGWKKCLAKTKSGKDYFRAENSDWSIQFGFGPSKSALANLPEDEEKFPLAIWFKRLLMEETWVLALNAEAMRLPSPVRAGLNLLPDGSNLPWTVHALETRDPARLGEWVDHLRTSLPDLRTVRTIERLEDRSRYVEVEYANGLRAPSWLLSDGTLRILALTLLAYSPSSPGTLLIEEPENGIHPQCIETVLQSLQSVYDAQVFLATHSPVVLGLLATRDLLCFAKTESGAVDVVAGPDHPRLLAWKGAVQLGDLLAAGVLG